MNVIISNKYHNELDKLNIDIIKSVSGVFEVNDIVEMFKNFFLSPSFNNSQLSSMVFEKPLMLVNGVLIS